MNKKHLHQPLMRRLPNHEHDNYFIVDGHSQDLLIKIRELMDVFAPIGDDHQHCYLFEHGPGQLRIEEHKKQFETVNAAMHYIMKRFVEEKKKLKTK